MNASTHLHSDVTHAGLADLAREAGLNDPAIVVRPLEDAAVPRALAGPLELRPRSRIYPASMIKTPLAAALAVLWERGELLREQTVEVTAANMTANDGDSPLVLGHVTTLEAAAYLMLTRSDNVATNVLIDAVGRPRGTEIVRALGLWGTAIRRKLSGSLPLIADPAATGRNAHPAGDAAALFELIARRAVPGAGWLHATLSDQAWNDKLSPGLRRGDRFAHKTGETDEFSHDGGILELHGGARYVLVVYTTLPASPENDARFAHFMRLLRDRL